MRDNRAMRSRPLRLVRLFARAALGGLLSACASTANGDGTARSGDRSRGGSGSETDAQVPAGGTAGVDGGATASSGSAGGAATGGAGGSTVGPLDCSNVGCSPPADCDTGCQAPCGCCSCTEGERQARGSDWPRRCIGGCWAPAYVGGCVQYGRPIANGESVEDPVGCNSCTCIDVDGFSGWSCTLVSCACPPESARFSFVSRDSAECGDIRFTCPKDTELFYEQCGCGCAQDPECPEVIDCRAGDSGCDPQLVAHCPFSAVLE